MPVSEEDIIKIREQILGLDKRKAVATSLLDLFALGSWLHFQGQTEAGIKAVQNSLESINLDKSNITLFTKTLDSLHGNERMYFETIHAHAEINDLWEKT